MLTLDGNCSVLSFAWLLITGSLVSWVVAGFLTPYTGRSRAIYWVRIFLIASGMCFMAEAFVGCSNTNHAFQTWLGVAQASVVCMSMSFFIFTLHFVNKE